MEMNPAIQRNHEALKRIVLGLVAMTGWSAAGAHEQGATLTRRLRNAVVSILRPAESAARRLIIAMAQGIEVTPPKLRPSKSAAARQTYTVISPSSVIRARDQWRKTGIILPANALKRIGPDGRIEAYLVPNPMPVIHRLKRKNSGAARGPAAFCLLDPPRTPCRRRTVRRAVPDHQAPRAWAPGMPDIVRPPLPQLPSPDDRVGAAGVARRLAALTSALNDLPAQARRFARWRARREARKAGGEPGNSVRIWPLRPGRPPGGRLTSWNPDLIGHPRRIREVDQILVETDSMACYALERPRRDSS